MYLTSFHFFAVHFVAVVVAAAAHTAASAVSATLAIITRNLLQRLHNGRTIVKCKLQSITCVLACNLLLILQAITSYAIPHADLCGSFMCAERTSICATNSFEECFILQLIGMRSA
jgi:hypothetical protein